MPGGHNIAPQARAFSGFTGSFVIAVSPQLCLRRHTFFCLARKKYAKKRRRTRNSAYAQKNTSFRVYALSLHRWSRNALRAARSISYTEISHLGKYLTYESRESFVLLRVYGLIPTSAHLAAGRCGHRPLRTSKYRRAFRIPYVKYSTGANETKCSAYRALRKPDSTVARRAFLDHLCNDNT